MLSLRVIITSTTYDRFVSFLFPRSSFLSLPIPLDSSALPRCHAGSSLPRRRASDPLSPALAASPLTLPSPLPSPAAARRGSASLGRRFLLPPSRAADPPPWAAASFSRHRAPRIRLPGPPLLSPAAARRGSASLGRRVLPRRRPLRDLPRWPAAARIRLPGLCGGGRAAGGSAAGRRRRRGR
ncbi:hypothetical protein PVAP13_2NG504203 [Panicum virgatum]|uniref:Uncharacterized protein n=1 Tax=Panicum virgatum TaxID=38727 RepID=A0A8T0W0Z4_PANVG|nr:hypothetical protein PVAP13_2NG504203 [Panicum virgatum]